MSIPQAVPGVQTVFGLPVEGDNGHRPFAFRHRADSQDAARSDTSEKCCASASGQGLDLQFGWQDDRVGLGYDAALVTFSTLNHIKIRGLDRFREMQYNWDLGYRSTCRCSNATAMTIELSRQRQEPPLTWALAGAPGGLTE